MVNSVDSFHSALSRLSGLSQISSVASTDSVRSFSLPPSARRPLLTKNLIKPDLDVFCAAASDSNEAIKEYLPQDELQSLSGDRAVNRIFDLLLENHADVLSDTAKACIQPGGRFREYMVEKVVNASRSAELLVVFNRFLGITTDIKNKATQKQEEKDPHEDNSGGIKRINERL
ncbi:MAG: hypothetical protein ACK5Q1_04770 [Limnobacter sp.]